VDPLSNAITQYRSYYSHGLVSKPLYDSFTKACLVESTYSDIQCGMDVHAIYSKMGNGINPYALDYPVCLENGRDSFYDQENAMRRIHSPSSQARQLLASVGPPFLSSEDHYKPCGEQHFTSYLNRDDVRDALHVRDADNIEWLSCSSRVKYSSSDRLASQINQYQDLIDMAVEGKHDLRLAVYSGDDDSICSLAGTQEWIYDLGVEPVASKMWKAWDAGNRQTAGYITEFNMGSQTNASFHLVTVHGAGHEVPTYRPFEALDLFRRYLNGAL